MGGEIVIDGIDEEGILNEDSPKEETVIAGSVVEDI